MEKINQDLAAAESELQKIANQTPKGPMHTALIHHQSALAGISAKVAELESRIAKIENAAPTGTP